MIAKCQISAMEQLHSFANRDIHSLVLEGPEGCGKTFVAKEFSRILGISDFMLVVPKVGELKNAIVTCINLKTPVVLCVENLDTGVLAASYALLKFLEEPLSSVYVVVTCRNIENVPDTIVSRCPVATIAAPNSLDRTNYAQARNSVAFAEIKNSPLWRAVRTFKDIDEVLNFKHEHMIYFQSLSEVLRFKDSVSNLMWKLGHYEDNSETPILLVIRYLIEVAPNEHIKQAGISCLTELSKSRIASHAVLAKFIFECKYCE